jgi:hypothetical protein
MDLRVPDSAGKLLNSTQSVVPVKVSCLFPLYSAELHYLYIPTIYPLYSAELHYLYIPTIYPFYSAELHYLYIPTI